MFTEEYDFNAFAGSAEYSRRYQRKYAAMFAPGARVVDVGCGEGVFLEMLRDAGAIGIGIDGSARMAEACRAKGLDVVSGDIREYFRTSSAGFDGAFCSHIIEHFAPADAMALLNAMHAALRRDGRLIIITPTFRDPIVMGEYFWLDITHVRPYPEALLRQMLASAGFRVISSGCDADTVRRMPRRRPDLALRFFINKLRHGKDYGCGDTFVIAQKL